MKPLKLVLLFVLLATGIFAKTLEWKDAKVAKISSESGGAMAAPIGTAVIGIPIIKTFYWIETEDMVYVLGPRIGKHGQLNLTLFGKTKIAIDGHNAHILDDDGKDRKVPIAQKIARVEAPNPKQ